MTVQTSVHARVHTRSHARMRVGVRGVLVALVISITGAFSFSSCAFPGDGLDDGEGIVGTYSVNGFDPLDVEYSGTVTIGATDEDDVYTIEWIVTGTIQEGVGRLTGDQFVVEWTTLTSARGESSGTATYTLDEDGVLRGIRFVDGVDDPGTEEIFPEA